MTAVLSWSDGFEQSIPLWSGQCKNAPRFLWDCTLSHLLIRGEDGQVYHDAPPPLFQSLLVVIEGLKKVTVVEHPLWKIA